MSDQYYWVKIGTEVEKVGEKWSFSNVHSTIANIHIDIFLTTMNMIPIFIVVSMSVLVGHAPKK